MGCSVLHRIKVTLLAVTLSNSRADVTVRAVRLGVRAISVCVLSTTCESTVILKYEAELESSVCITDELLEIF